MGNLTSVLKRIGNKINKNSPLILTCTAAAGVIVTAVLAVKATPAAMNDICMLENPDDFLGEPDGETFTVEFTLTEKIKCSWRHYIPAALMGTATITCIFGAHAIGAKRQAALSGAYTLAQTALTEYKSKVIENLGENVDEKIRSELAQDHLDTNPVGVDVPIPTGSKVLCFDSYSGRYFFSDYETLRHIENNLNHKLISDDYVGLNELYNQLGLEPIKLGDDLGWMSSNLIEFKLDTRLASNNQPCIVLDYIIDTKTQYLNGF